jgi:hypothetical protein
MTRPVRRTYRILSELPRQALSPATAVRGSLDKIQLNETAQAGPLWGLYHRWATTTGAAVRLSAFLGGQ